MCSKNVATELQKAMSFIFGVVNPLNTEHYLGLPSLVDKKKRAIFAYINDRLRERL